MQRVSALPGPRLSLGSLTPGSCPLAGKSLYLDEVKSRSVSALTDAISRLGGKVESFLHKDVNIVVTGNRDALNDFPATPGTPTHPGEGANDAARRPGTPRPLACGSRGKALLEKAMRNHERSRGTALTSAARLWGVKVVYVEDFLKFVDRLTLELLRQKSRKCETGKESSALRVVKAGSLKADFLKVEDSSRKYRPLHVQCLSFPVLTCSRTCSPFENPAENQALEKRNERKNDDPISSREEKPSATPSPKLSVKKKSLGYCECCQINYKNQEEHLRSEVHQRFARDVQNYAVVDRLVADMGAVFTDFKGSRGDPQKTRSSGGQAASLTSAGPMESPPKNSRTNRPVIAINDAGAQPDSEAVPHLVLQPQEVGPGAPNPLDEENETRNEVSNPANHETPLPGPRAGSGPDPEAQSPQPSRSVEDLTDPEPLPAQVQPVQVTERGDTHLGINPTPRSPAELPPGVPFVRESRAWPSRPALSDCLSFPLTPLNLSSEVNPRKHSRSFTLSPNVLKKRRTGLKSDPTSRSSGVELLGPTICDSQKRLGKQPDGERSSELGPPRLYPFYYDDVQNQPPFYDPPALTPSVPLPSPGSKPHPCSGASLLSQSFSSVCIDPALVPDVTFSPASSESDWDSGLLSHLAPVGQVQHKERRCELDLGSLLQRSCAGMQEAGSYASRLCSVLQPAAPSRPAFGDGTMWRPMETVDRWIVPRLGV